MHPDPQRGHDAVRRSARLSRVRGAVVRELSLFWVGMAGTVGNVVGSWLAYWAGA